jgi:3-hydroxyacyl-CoA dehydrogenase
MGGGIAALIANAGIPVYLLDIAPQQLLDEEGKRGLSIDSQQVRNRIVAASLERIKRSTPPAFASPEAVDLITIGNLVDNFDWISEGDWIIEVIVEDLAAKRLLLGRIDTVRKPNSIVSSNTSGLPITALSKECSAELKSHFLGTHFFTPPRYMKLFEVIPTAATDPEVTKFMTGFAERRLGKGVVQCNDTPNFIANRLVAISVASLVGFVLDNGYTVEEADSILGPLIGRPNTALFRMQDLVGLDVAAAVAANLYGLIEHDESREVLHHPKFLALLSAQLERGRLGDKTRQGFYKKPWAGVGVDKSEILTLDFATMEYRARCEPQIASLRDAARIEPLAERLAFVLGPDDKMGALARHAIYGLLGYAARRIPEITGQLINVDRAMRWGYSHDLGPFELWDALGVSNTVEAMNAEGVMVASWVLEMLAAGHKSFYVSDNGRLSYYEPVRKTYVTGV